MSSLKDLRNRLKKLESEKVSTACNEQHTSDHTGTLDFTGERTSLISKVQRNGNKPNDWLELIRYMENANGQFATNNTRHLYISNLYADALKNIPDGEKKTLPYARLLIYCANFRGQQSVEDAREMFQDARYDAKKFAIVHIAAAQFELSLGNKDKAKKILDKAKSQQAEPLSFLTKAFSNLVYGERQLLNELDEHELMDDENKENSETVESMKETVELLRKITSGGQQHPGPNHLTDHTLELHNRLNAGSHARQRPRLSESSDDSHSQSQKVGAFKPPQHPKSSYRKRHPTPTEKKEDDTGFVRERTGSDQVSDDADTIPMEQSSHNNTGCLETVLNKQPHSMQHPRSIRKYHSTPDMKKVNDMGVGSSGSSVRGFLARKKMNLSKPMRIPKKSPLTETDESPLLLGLRRQSESDDESIRLKPLPEFSPDKPKDQQRDMDHSPVPFEDVRNFRGSVDSDSGIMSQTGTDNLTNQLHPEQRQHSAPHNLVETHDNLEPKFSHRGPNLEPKASQTKTLLDASQLSTKTLINSSLVDGLSCSKTLTNNGNNRNKVYPESDIVSKHENVHSEGANQLNPRKEIVHQSSNSGTDSGISKDCGPASNHNQLQVGLVQPFVGHGQSQMNQGQVVAVPQVQQYNVMQTPHQKQPHHSMPVCTPVQLGQGMSVATPMQQQGYSQYPQAYPHMMQHQMMTPMHQSQQKMLVIKGKCYTVIRCIGKGGYSKVYEVLDQEYTMRAVKCVNMDAVDESTIESYKNEIELLQRLQYSRLIIKMFDYEYNENDNMLYVVMEKGERDLATFFRSRMKRGDMSLELLFFYWKEMLQAVQVLHKEGIVHSDLKPPNFLIVSGDLKLIDFGIAKAIQPDMTSVTREQQVGTLNYMSPEAFMDTCGGTQRDEQGRVKPKIKIGVKSDVWSLGCILYYLVYSKTPFQHISNAWMKLQAITNNDVDIEFPPLENFGTMDTTQLVNILKRCLTRDPKLRPSIEELLDTPLWKQKT